MSRISSQNFINRQASSSHSLSILSIRPDYAIQSMPNDHVVANSAFNKYFNYARDEDR